MADHRHHSEELKEEVRWVARLTPVADGSLAALLRQSLGLDVWQRVGETLVVAAAEARLSEIERRRLARVERLSTVADYLARAASLDEGEARGTDP